MGGSSCHYSSSDSSSNSCVTYGLSDAQLSAGAITGIVVGCLIAILIIVIVIIFGKRVIARRRPPVTPFIQQPHVVNPPQAYPQMHQPYMSPQPPSYSQAMGNNNELK